MALSTAASAGPFVRAEKLEATEKSTINAGIFTKNYYGVPSPSCPVAHKIKVDATPNIRSSFFLGRDEVLVTLENHFNSGKLSSNTAALCGMAGVGKTQCALDFCRRRRDAGYSVFWVNAQSLETLLRSFRDICGQLSVDPTDPVSSFKGWLQGCPKSLLVFDNVDSVETIQVILPQHATEILITTKDSGLVGAEMIPFGVDVPLLSERDSIIIFLLNIGPWNSEQDSNIRKQDKTFSSLCETVREALKSRYSLDDVAQIRAVISDLGRLPLAIVQCASYLRQYKMPFTKYRMKLRAKTPEARRKFHAYRWMKGAAYQDSVMTAWDISFEKLGQDEPETLKLITLFGFLGRNQISTSFLESALEDSMFWGGKGMIQAPAMLKDFFAFLLKDLDEGIGLLSSLSLITYDTDQGLIYVHPMVHEYIHLRMAPTEAAKWLGCVTMLLSHGLPPLMYSHEDLDAPSKADRTFLHLDRAAELGELYTEDLARFQSLHGVSPFFLEAYLWYQGIRYLDLAESIIGEPSAPSQTNIHRWDYEILYVTRLLSTIDEFCTESAQTLSMEDLSRRLDDSAFRKYVDKTSEVPSGSTAYQPDPKSRTLQATLSDRWKTVLVRDSRKIRGLKEAMNKLPTFPWQDRLDRTNSSIDRVVSAVFVYCKATAKLANQASRAEKRTLLSLMQAVKSDALFGVRCGCSELKFFFGTMLQLQLDLFEILSSESDAVELLEMLQYLISSRLKEKLIYDWDRIERSLYPFASSLKVRTAARFLVERETTEIHVLRSPKLRSVVLGAYQEQEDWLRSRIAMYERDLHHPVQSITIKKYELVLAEVLSNTGQDRLPEVKSLLEGVLGRVAESNRVLGKHDTLGSYDALEADETPGGDGKAAEVAIAKEDEEPSEPKNFSDVSEKRFTNELLDSILDSVATKFGLKSCGPVLGLFLNLGHTPKLNPVLVSWIRRQYRDLTAVSPETVMTELFELFVPNLSELTDDPETMSALDQWGFFVISLIRFSEVGSNVNELTFLDGYRLCRDICKNLERKLRLDDKRNAQWRAKRNEFQNILGLFGSWELAPQKGRDIDLLTKACIRIQQSREHADEIDKELIACGFETDAVRKSSAETPATKMSIPTARDRPKFVPLPLGRILGTKTEIKTALYHGPNCGLWIAKETDESDGLRSTMFWTRYGKPGVFYADLTSQTRVKRYHRSFLLLEFIDVARNYSIFRLHYGIPTDRLFVVDGEHVLRTCKALGIETEDNQPMGCSDEFCPSVKDWDTYEAEFAGRSVLPDCY